VDDPVFVSRKRRGGGRLHPLVVLRIVRGRGAACRDCIAGGRRIHLVQATLGQRQYQHDGAVSARAAEGEFERIFKVERGRSDSGNGGAGSSVRF
jgi:hypothetical protein